MTSSQKRQVAITKRQLIIRTLASVCITFLIFWGIITIIFVVAATATQNELTDALIGSVMFFLFFLVLTLSCSLSIIPGLNGIKRQEKWFSLSFDLELNGQFIKKNIFVNDTWYICVSGMRLFAFRKGYITKVVKTRLDKQHRTDIILTVNTIDGRVLKLYFQRGDEHRIKLLKEFVLNY